GVIFKKYSPVGELTDITDQYADVLYRNVTMPVIICDRDHAISVAGISKREFADRRISAELESLMEDRSNFIRTQGEKLTPFEGSQHNAAVAVPIISSGDVLGAVVLLSSEGVQPSQTDMKLTQVAASFIGKQMED
ncbi:MAG: GAF domain-containing protein, partial [Clostridia bacterium]|nr:GAF domain-containing protein [Clostridia bacterium]